MTNNIQSKSIKKKNNKQYHIVSLTVIDTTHLIKFNLNQIYFFLLFSIFNYMLFIFFLFFLCQFICIYNNFIILYSLILDLYLQSVHMHISFSKFSHQKKNIEKNSTTKKEKQKTKKIFNNKLYSFTYSHSTPDEDSFSELKPVV